MKRHKPVTAFEEHPVSEESRNKNIALIAEFEEQFCLNCQKQNRYLTNVQNTALFVAGSITRLLWPPRTHYADYIKRVSQNMYVQVKK